MAKEKNESFDVQGIVEEECQYSVELVKLDQEQEHLCKRIEDIKHNLKEKKKEFENGQINVKQFQMIQKMSEEEIRDLDLHIHYIEHTKSKLEQSILEKCVGFDKYICLENIRLLLNNSDIRIGQIEKEAGCTVGYLSRLEKEGNKSSPSIEFLYTAAKTLKVTIDTLINGRLSDLSETEQYLLEFISKLIKDTKSDEIVWNKETPTYLEKVDYSYESGYMFAEHPLFECYSVDDDNVFTQTVHVEYKSRFFPDSIVRPFKNSYNAKLPNTCERIFIMSVSSVETPNDEILELYIVGDSVNQLCNSSQLNESINEAIRDLYKEIEVVSSHVHINEDVRSVIGKYLGGKR